MPHLPQPPLRGRPPGALIHSQLHRLGEVGLQAAAPAACEEQGADRQREAGAQDRTEHAAAHCGVHDEGRRRGEDGRRDD